MTEHQPEITVIGTDTRIKGEMTFDRTARILGKFEGQVKSSGELQIGETAECKASLEAMNVVVDGLVEGNIVAKERVQLNGSARVIGDVVAERLIVAEGASFDGRCRVGAEAVAAALQPASGSTLAAGATKPAPAAAPTSAPKLETPVAEVKASTGAGFDWVGKGEEKAGSGWGPRPSADGAA